MLAFGVAQIGRMPALCVRSRWKTAAMGRSLSPLHLARIGPVTRLPYSGYSENWEMRELDGTKWGSSQVVP